MFPGVHLRRRAAGRVAVATVAALGLTASAFVAGAPASASWTAAAASTDSEGQWQLVRTETNPTGEEFGSSWSGAVSDSSASLTTTVGEASVAAQASWGQPDSTLTPGEPFVVDVTASISAAGPGPAYYSLTVIPKVSGTWNRNTPSVSAEGQCGDPAWGGDPMECSADTTTDVLSFDAPSGGETFDVGVSILNCGGACEVRWTYEWVDSPGPDAGPADGTLDNTGTDAGILEPSSPAGDPGGDSATDPWDPERSADLLAALRADAELLDSQHFVWTALTEAIFEGRPAEEALLVLRDLTDSFFEVRISRLERAGGADDPDVAALIAHLRELQARRASEIAQTIADVRGKADDDETLDPSMVRAVLTDGPDVVGRDAGPPGEDIADDAESVDVLDSVHDANEQPDLHQAMDDQAARVLGDPPEDADSDSDADSGADPGPSPTSTPPPVGVGTPDYDDDLDLRPVWFVNDGLTPVTVRADTYEPASDLAGTPMSRASTVVFVDPNPSAYLDLPRGRYTFCYDWELGDVDGDDMIDYAHRTSGPAALTSDTPLDPALAPSVTLSPPSRTSTPNGRCPGVREDGADPATSLTPAQRLSTAPATYTVACDYTDGSQQTFSKRYWFAFSEGAGVWNDADAAPVDLAATADNVYEFSSGSYRLELTDSGFDLFSLAGDDPLFCRAVRQGPS